MVDVDGQNQRRRLWKAVNHLVAGPNLHWIAS